MLTRFITGILFVGTIIAAMYFGPISAFLLLLLVSVLGSLEFTTLIENNTTYKLFKAPLLLSNILLLTLFFLNKFVASISLDLSLFIIIPFFYFIIELFAGNKTPLENISLAIFSMMYTCIPFCLLFEIGYFNGETFYSSFSPKYILAVFGLIWSNDTGAYLSGKFLGKNKLFERISPKKTWEGAIGGVVLGILISYLLSLLFSDLYIFSQLAVLNIIIGIAGIMGDLVESMIKRQLKIKDSGTILPGHGGILDRFDSLILVVPFVYFYLHSLT